MNIDTYIKIANNNIHIQHINENKVKLLIKWDDPIYDITLEFAELYNLNIDDNCIVIPNNQSAGNYLHFNSKRIYNFPIVENGLNTRNK